MCVCARITTARLTQLRMTSLDVIIYSVQPHPRLPFHNNTAACSSTVLSQSRVRNPQGNKAYSTAYIGRRTQIITELVASEVQEALLGICASAAWVSWRNFAGSTRYALRFRWSPLLVSYPPASRLMFLGQGHTDAGRLHSLQWPLIFASFRFETCSMSPFLRLEFWGDAYSFGNVCTPIRSLEQVLSSSQGTSSEEDTGLTVICNIKICYEFSYRATSCVGCSR